jgi:hypothetical protein
MSVNHAPADPRLEARLDGSFYLGFDSNRKNRGILSGGNRWRPEGLIVIEIVRVAIEGAWGCIKSGAVVGKISRI